MNETVPEILLACTLRGTLLIGIAWVAAPWVRRWFGQNSAHWLWLAVLPVLLWPVPPHTPFSLRSAWPVQPDVVAAIVAPDLVPSAETGAGPLMVKVRKTVAETPQAQEPAAAEQSMRATSKTAMTRQTSGWGNWSEWLGGMWIVGAVICLGHLAWRWWRTLQLLREARPITDARVERILTRFGKRGAVELAVISSIRAPALAGIWRPRILIPEGWMDELEEAELESVLLHELGHQVRADLVWEWLYAIARCLHWMNPAVWIAERMARQARELACDAWAMERSQYPEQYGEALLDALKRMQRGPAPTSFGVAAMAEDARQISRRLEWIARGSVAPRWLVAIGWLPGLIALLAVGSDPVVAQSGERVAEVPPSAAAPATAPDASAANHEKPPGAMIPIPLAKRTVEARMRILRLPETMARRLGWPIADDGSNGSEKLFSAEEFRGVMATLQASPEVELLPGPRLATRSGKRGDFFALREFRYGRDYKASAGGLQVPGTTEVANLGMSVLWQPEIEDEATVRLDLTVALTRLAGFVNEKGVTKTSPPFVGAPWMQRLVSYEVPAGTAGQPQISEQKAHSQLVLNTAQVAVVFGFRDADRIPAPGASEEQTMVNYFAVQMQIAP